MKPIKSIIAGFALLCIGGMNVPFAIATTATDIAEWRFCMPTKRNI